MDLILLTEVNLFFLKIDFVESISPLIEAETNSLMYNKTVKYNAKRHVIVRQNLVEILYLSAIYPVITINKKVKKYKMVLRESYVLDRIMVSLFAILEKSLSCFVITHLYLKYVKQIYKIY
jgi:hypothetical protein